MSDKKIEGTGVESPSMTSLNPIHWVIPDKTEKYSMSG
jgi:hypothetical protein